MKNEQKLPAKIRRQIVSAISSYSMLKNHDRLLVAVSGGIDSGVMLLNLLEIQRRAPFQFELQPVIVDHHFPGFDVGELESWIKSLGLRLISIDCDTYSLITKHPSRESPCQICSRLRRGALYTYAQKHRYSKIALGHNRDDLNETLLMNLFFSGKLAGMPPKLKASDGYNTVIRPLCTVSKRRIREYASLYSIPILSNDFCDHIPNNTRYRIRSLLRSLEDQNPKIPDNILAAQGNINLSSLMDKSVWDCDH